MIKKLAARTGASGSSGSRAMSETAEATAFLNRSGPPVTHAPGGGEGGAGKRGGDGGEVCGGVGGSGEEGGAGGGGDGASAKRTSTVGSRASSTVTPRDSNSTVALLSVARYLTMSA